ncbi:dockerin type I repeat-containing protein [Herbivorax sp. ANBcel31]|uniref:dockerin type I repeat-containing protein n=1 Tax=Herbivorax sp. ANBcel31 TaxID=3069754 RepID=UPI0027B06337|nr:dockerin type I repeat-containing protein [Herbivorax sp. ANBcel31]MDQ2085388.1 dockerin type I repeat-containing protein [Herbivorax sp. ANBcel31]
MKNKSIIALCIVFLLSMSGFTCIAYSDQFVYGDVDGNGSVDSSDYSLVKRYVLGIQDSFSYQYGEIAADVNGDGIIDSSDYVLIVRYILDIISEFPVSTQQPPIPTPEPTPEVSGNVTYTIFRAENPTSEEQDAYRRIEEAMETAVSYYNTYTTITKELVVLYEPSVPTADGNINGTIRFGNTSYMNHVTAMHEIAHTVGVGTSHSWRNLIVDGTYAGENATKELRAITGDDSATLKGDGQHFWPYGLNYVHEAETEEDLINHCRIVNAMKKDGL